MGFVIGLEDGDSSNGINEDVRVVSSFKIGIGVNITNVITAPLIYPVNYWVDVRLVGVSREVNWPRAPGYAEFLALIKQSPLILVDLSIGGLILGTPLAMAGYVIVLRAVRRFR